MRRKFDKSRYFLGVFRQKLNFAMQRIYVDLWRHYAQFCTIAC